MASVFIALVFATGGSAILWLGWRATPTFNELFDPRYGDGVGLIGAAAILLGALIMVGGSLVRDAERRWRIGLTLLFCCAIAVAAWWLEHPTAWPPRALLIASALASVLGIFGLFTPRSIAWFRHPRAAVAPAPPADAAQPAGAARS